MRELLRDLRYAARGLVRAPGFSFIAVSTLALGIGGTTAVFTVLNAALLRPLDFPEPGRLVRFHVGMPMSAQQVDGVAARANSYQAVAPAARTSFVLTGDGEPEEVVGSVVGEQHADVFGVAPAMGRAFALDDSQPGAEPVAILSHELWERRFGGDPDILGRVLSLGGEGQGTRTVVGVWPPDYSPFSWGSDVFVPLVRDTNSELYADMVRYQVAARLAPGVAYATALEELRTTLRRMSTGAEGAIFSDGIEERAVLASYQEAETADVRGGLWLLLAAVVAVLLVACGNVMNLTLARSTARSHEFAVRSAIGAGRGRVVRQVLTESLLVAVLGGVVGGVAAVLSLPVLLQWLPLDIRHTAVSLDPRVLGFALGTVLLSGVASGLVPALRATRIIGSTLTSSSRTLSTSRGGFRLNRALVGVQVGLCMLLVVGSGLLLKSLWKVSQVDPGFTVDALYTMRVRPNPETYPDAASRQAYFMSVLESVRAVPGVGAAGAIQVLPMSQGNMGVGISPDGAPVPDGERPTFVGYRLVSSDYGSAMEIPLLEGRWIDAGDGPDATAVGMINASMAARLFPDGAAVGRTVHWNTGDPWFTVVGVIGDVHQNRLDEAPRMEAYVPLMQDGSAQGLHLMIRSSIGSAVLPAVRRAAWAVDANVPITMDAAMEDVVATSMAGRRSQAVLLSLFGGLALLLGMIGVYGVTSYVVNQRRHEMGVRLALGAGRGRLIRSVLASSLTPVAIGLVSGLAGATVMGRLLSGTLYEVTPTDPTVLLGVGLVLGLVATLAALGPAARAARVDPMSVLAEA